MRKCLNDNWLFIYLFLSSPFHLPSLPRLSFSINMNSLWHFFPPLVVHFLWTSFVVVSFLFPLFLLVSLSLLPLLGPGIFLTLLCHFSSCSSFSFFPLAAAFIFIFIIICAFLVPFVIIVFLFAVVVVVAVLDVSYFVFFVWYFVWFNHNSVEARQKASNQTQLSALLGNSFPLPLLLALSLPLPASSQQSKSSQHWTSVFRGHLYSSSSPASSACASEIARVCSCVCVCVLGFERFDSIRFHYDQHILPSL